MKIKMILFMAALFVTLVPAMCFAIEVEEAVICRDIQERQPVGESDSFSADVGKVWCWSKIRDGENSTIKHAYYYGTEEKAVVELQIRSPLFRTYSSKKIIPNWTGEWRVDIVDADGNLLKSLSFSIGEEAQPEQEAQPDAEAAPEADSGEEEMPAPEAEGSHPKVE